MDIMDRRTRGFVLWRPARTTPVPRVKVVRFMAGSPPTYAPLVERELAQSPEFDDLWELSFSGLDLPPGEVLHYWFLTENDHPGGPPGVVAAPDPFARVVDYRLSPEPAAGVFRLEAGRMVECDPDGGVGTPVLPSTLVGRGRNSQLVVYEIPSSWTRGRTESGTERDVGAFRDVLALLTPDEPGGNFRDMEAVANRAHLLELGVNAVELLPPADSPFSREWGYGTGNYFAADFDLGFPFGHTAPSAERDLCRLVARMHELGIRFFLDAVMAFGHSSYKAVNFHEFFVDPRREPSNPDSYQSSRNGELRDGYGGSSWRYQAEVSGYDPISGTRRTYAPARLYLMTHALRWLRELGVDGLRLDSVNNIGNWDFVGDFCALAREEYRRLYAGEANVDAYFLSVGEELSVPLDLVRQRRLDCLWNERYKHRLRSVILGRGDGDETFRESLANLLDCRRVGFTDGAQVVNYVTSHDVEGYQNERLFLFLQNNGVPLKLERCKLAFASLFASVGIPMIFAGEEFADEHDRGLGHPDKQQDPLNFSRLADPWRRELFEYVARLVRFRIESEALSTNDIQFIHEDFSADRRIVAFVRGDPAREDPVVVVANFSAERPPGDEYRVPGFPRAPVGRRWREVSQGREVPDAWIGREPLYPWEAKIYALV